MFSSESTCLALFTYDLERRRNDCDQQRYKPERQNEDPAGKEQRAYEVIAICNGIKQVGVRVRRHNDKDQLQRLQDVVEALCAAVRICTLYAQRSFRAKESFVRPCWHSRSWDIRLGVNARDVFEMTTAELFFVREVTLALRIDPDTMPSEARFKALNTNDGKQKPEEADQEGNVHK
ncbi:hypothetical protein DPSP01_014746 [Paraphaeosphaeria sporulosa]